MTYAIDNLCDLIVMALRGSGAAFARPFWAGVSSYVLRNADVPVLIVKEGTNE